MTFYHLTSPPSPKISMKCMRQMPHIFTWGAEAYNSWASRNSIDLTIQCEEVWASCLRKTRHNWGMLLKQSSYLIKIDCSFRNNADTWHSRIMNMIMTMSLVMVCQSTGQKYKKQAWLLCKIWFSSPTQSLRINEMNLHERDTETQTKKPGCAEIKHAHPHKPINTHTHICSVQALNM